MAMPRGTSCGVAALLLIVAAPQGQARSQAPSTEPPIGVRHVLTAALSFSENSPYAKTTVDRPKVNLRVSVRISDHAPDADFFGMEVTDFTDADLGAAEKTIWQAAKCHRDRGLPKVTIARIEGTVLGGAQAVAISAVPRRIGKLIPADEIIVTKRWPRILGQLIGDLAIRAETKFSRVVLDLRLKVIRCEL